MTRQKIFLKNPTSSRWFDSLGET